VEIRPIETHYAGCRFRSRLEARWAVFFDHMEIPWEFEAQGYETAGGRYLPDFFLPDNEIWVEVKGVMSHADMAKMLLGLRDLRPYQGRQITPQLLLLGPVPRPGTAWLHARFDVFHNHILYFQTFFEAGIALPYAMGTPGTIDAEALAALSDEQSEPIRRSMISAWPDNRLTVDPVVDEAYRAARSARFEFGERG
jgi:hypothetical protein